MTSVKKLTWKILGFACLGLGAIGIFLPLLPTTPFVLGAVFAFSKGSPELAKWLEDHRLFGPLITDWREKGSISPAIKLLACAMMAVSLIGSAMAGFATSILVTQAIVILACAGFILSRPNG